MCYKYNLKFTGKMSDLEEKFQAKADADFEIALYEEAFGFDNPPMPVITNAERDKIQIYNWGLIGNHVKDIEEARKMAKMCTLARIEDLTTTRSYKDIYKTQRCIVLATGYIEYKHLDSAGKNKEKYELCMDETEFAFGGLYNIWTEPGTNHRYKTFAIVTTAANAAVAAIHKAKRMPIMLKADQVNTWLDDKEELNYYTEITQAQNIEAKLLDRFSQATLF